MAEVTPPSRPRRRRRRFLWTAAAVLILLPSLIVLGFLASLRLEGVRRAILGRISAILAQDYGLAFAAKDFTPLWRPSGVELQDVRLGAPRAAPLATARRIVVHVELGSLRRRPLVVRSLEADGLRIDLTAPLPQLPESPPQEAGAGPPVEIHRIVLRGGEIRGGPLEEPVAKWVRIWIVRGIGASGSYRGGRLAVAVERGEAVLDRPDFGLQKLRLAGRIAYEEKKPLRIDALRVTGDGLRLSASGTVGLEGSPTAARFDLYAEPRALAAGVPHRGSLRAAGRISLPENSGQVTLTAEEIPAEALRAYLDPKLFSDLSLAGSVVEVKARASAGPRDWGRIEGAAEAIWRRGPRQLVIAKADMSPGDEAPLTATISAELLPGSPGRRSVQGTVRAASWTELGQASADALRAEVRVPDVQVAMDELRSLWPHLVPDPPEGAPLQGSLTADARVSGSLGTAKATLNATWLPQPGSRVDVEAKGNPRTWSGSAKVRTEDLPLELLAAMAPGLTGTVTGAAELSGSPSGYRTRMETVTADLALAPNLQHVDSAAVCAEGTLVLNPLSYHGTLSIEGSGLVARPNASSTARLATFRIETEGLFKGEPLSYTGKASVAGESAEMEGIGQTGRFAALADGALEIQPLSYDGTLSLDAYGVEQPGTAQIDHLRFAAEGRGSSDLKALSARVQLDADRVAVAEPEMEIRNLHVEAEGDGREVRLDSLSGEVPEGRTFRASGRFLTEPLLAEADLDLRLVTPVDALPAVDLTARLRNGAIEVNAARVETVSGPGTLQARVPLGALLEIPQLGALESLEIEKAQGPVSLSVDFPALDSEPLLAALGMEARPERIRAGLAADLSLDLAAPAAGRGEVRLSGLTVETPDGNVTAESPAVLHLADGRISLAPLHLRIAGGAVQGAGAELRASAELERSWRPFEDSPAAAVTRISAEGNGIFDASLLNPYLQGGAAEGSLSLSATASGPPDALTAEVRASGPEASFVWPAAALQVKAPQLAMDLEAGEWTIRDGRMGVNGGTVNLAGGGSPGGGLGVEAELSGVRFRLDYGIETLLTGRLALQAPHEGRMLLSGRVVVNRGVLDRDLNLDREVFTLLFKPPEALSTEESALAAVDLDLGVETRAGVRIRNNVGDLRASWRRLEVGGTLANPIIRGRIDIDPGGLFYAYGQTVRIDRGSLVFTGDPLTDPQIDLATTTSLQDPSITGLRGESPLALLARRGDDEEDKPGTTAARIRASLEQGLTGYYGARFAQRLAESVGLRGFSVRPVLVFNEADPSARLTVSRDLSSSVTAALSVDLRNADRQTYLVEVHELPSLPGLRLEGFTNDQGNEGASLQQAFTFGAGETRRRPSGPRLRRVEISAPKEGISKRSIRRATGLEKREPVTEGTAFSVEVDVASELRRRGYPDPRIAVAVEPVASRPDRVDVKLTVEPGPKVSFIFEGDRPPRALRPEITGLYRTDFYEETSRQEMAQAAARAFRSFGHLDPRVEIEVRRERPADPDGPRTVVVRTAAGPRASFAELKVAGLAPEDEQLVAAAFLGTLARAELAAGLPGADARLLNVLRSLGYPDARIAGRRVEAGGSRLAIEIESSPRQTLAAVRVAGVDEAEQTRLLALLPLRPGDPARLDAAVQGAGLLERDLRDRGYADAAVRSSLATLPRGAGETARVELTYSVTPGRRYLLAGIQIEGGRRPSLLRRETGLATGEPFVEADVEEARNRLFLTGVFSRVDTEVAKQPGGDALVSFSLAERRRYRLGYGVRWESEEGTAAVLDFVDRNFLGRALTLGLRGLYQSDDRSGRLFLGGANILGTRISLESYAEERRRVLPGDDNFREDRRELALQASRPLGESASARLYARYRTTHLFEIDPDPLFPIDLEIRLPYLGVLLLRDTRDDAGDPRSGLLASLDLSGSGGFLGSDFEYLRLFAQGAVWRDLSLAGRPLTWAQAVRVGVARPFAGQTLISQERFFAGGPFSVRGYEHESLGPRESFGGLDEVVGGEALLVINEELRFPLPWDLTGLVFFDAGQVWDDPADADFHLAKALGLGLRMRSPVGLLRLDAAYPLDRRRGDPAYKLYLGFGNAF